MDIKKLIKILGFWPKENTSNIFIKKYQDNYFIELDFENQHINYGNKISSENKSTQNFSQLENFVVLECVNRLLEKGYKPENITIEKTWSAGHRTSGRLDICVTRDDGSEYLLIECKTFGKEFEKEFSRMKKDGGQLFTYFKFSNKADLLVLYASEIRQNEIVYKNEIVKIEEDYRTGDVKDFFDKWSKFTKDNGVFNTWVKPYSFESKAIRVPELVSIKAEDSSFIFNRFLEILRHNVVSDKPNAFNKIFTLFLCKIYDEKSKEGTDEQLDFQWIEGTDDHISFQLRLTDLYKKGMDDFLEKKVTDFSDDEFDSKYSSLFNGDENLKNLLKKDIAKLRLEKNNEFAIKEVYDRKSFLENAKVVKEVVVLLQNFKIRYSEKQQYLSDFFELLLTTGLKQESGQFFTPVPIAQFVIKSLPIDTIVNKKLSAGKRDDLLPFIMDYAAGSGHFLTESMHEIQRLLLNTDVLKLKSEARSFIDVSKIRHFDWALKYVYGIEKDYRLVKVGKVGCYLHGDGLANVIHSDGLANFKHKDYKGKLSKTDKDFPQENKQFEILVSNPPYSVSAFKNASREYYRENDFSSYDNLTENSSEIECLFIERTKQLLKDAGVAGIILPSSILSNSGVYAKSREILLEFFEIIGIAELGSNTFMATGTNTVTLFLRRRNNYESINLKISVQKLFSTLQDITLNGVEKPIEKYVSHVWENIVLEDYKTLLQKEPNKNITEHEIYKEYRNKLKFKSEKEFWNLILEKEEDKIYYFILAYPQKVVLVKSGQKKEEKRFLGYEFSNRRGSEGIHPIQRGKHIEDCTQLFDPEVFDNPTKASTYIYKAFQGDYNFPIDEAMQKNVTRHILIDMLTFDRADFDKSISLSIKKKVKIESKWDLVKISDISKEIINGKTPSKNQFNFWDKNEINWLTINDINENKLLINETENFISRFALESKKVKLVPKNSVLVSCTATIGKVGINNIELTTNQQINSILCNDKILPYYLASILKVHGNLLSELTSNSGVKHINLQMLNDFKIPLPPKEIQEKIVAEVEVLEQQEAINQQQQETLKNKIKNIFNNQEGVLNRLDKVCLLKAGKFVKAGDIYKTNTPKLFPCYGGNGLRGFIETFTNNGQFSLVGRQGALCGNVHLVSGKFHATEHALVVYPKENVNTVWLHYKLIHMNLNQYATGTAQPGLSVMNLNPIEIHLPSLKKQEKLVSETEKIENKITALEKEILEIPKQKEAILKKYL